MATKALSTTAPRRTRSRAVRNEAITGFLFISPWIVGFLIFTLGPMLASAYYSLTSWDLIGTPQFVGLRNYQRLWLDPLFWQALKVTSLYALGRVPLGIIFGLAVALLLNQNVRFIGLWRTLYYLPVVLPPVAVSLLWTWIYNPEYGVLNWTLSGVGIEGPNWLSSSTWVVPALVAMAVWSVTGRYMIIYLSGLRGISQELYDAAAIDGANGTMQFWKITLPLMTPVLFFNLVMGMIDSFKVFTQAYVMTQGGPRNSSLFYVYYLYQQAFQRFNMGYASALAWAFFLIILVLTLVVFRSSSLWVYYESESADTKR